jgi:two-component system, OmpR family, response regulator
MSPYILIVDDDPDFSAMLRDFVTTYGYETTVVGSGSDMRRVMSTTKVDLILLDLGLPEENGLELLKELRSEHGIPIIVVTGKGDEIDRIIGLELGADDYIAKPFSLRELLARIRSVWRRSQGASISTVPESVTGREVAKFDGWTLNLGSRRLSSDDNETTQLTTAEFNLLKSLVSNPNEVLSRDRLLDLVYGSDYHAADRIIDTLVMRLRRKIEKDSAAPELITTVRGVGYIFSIDVDWL